MSQLTVRFAVTTPLSASPAELSAARAAARRHGVELAERRGEPLEATAARHGVEALLVLSRRRACLWIDGAEHRWSAGMGELRLKRLIEGERPARGAVPGTTAMPGTGGRSVPGTGRESGGTRDGFLDAAGLRPGDAVLDATLGLGMDALVAAAAVGPTGRVLGIERSPALAAFTAEGLARHPSEAARRVEVLAGNAAEVLSRLAERTFDVVVFDPMFRRARGQQSGFDVVRRLGDPSPLVPDTLARARAVARRWVVVKDGAPGWDLRRLGLTPLPASRWSERLYARVEAS